MYLEFERQLEGFDVPVERQTRTLDKILGQITREGARVWLRAWLAEGVPVETGAAMATLQPLGRFLRVAVDIQPSRQPYQSKLEGGLQDIGMGHEKQSFVIRDDRSHPRTYLYDFKWRTSMLHYMHKKWYNGYSTPGDEAILIANQAEENYTNRTIPRRVSKTLQNFLRIRRNGRLN